MKITVEPTDQLVLTGTGSIARVFVGETERGTPLVLLVSLIVAPPNVTSELDLRDLGERLVPLSEALEGHLGAPGNVTRQ